MARVSKSYLQAVVDDYNKRYCKNTKNELCLAGAYGNYGIRLTGKRDKRYKNPRWRKGSLRSGQSDVTYGYQSPKKVLDDFYGVVRSGGLKRKINYWEKVRCS